MRLRVVALLSSLVALSAATQQRSARPPSSQEARLALRHGDFDAALALANGALARPTTPQERELLLISKADAIVQTDTSQAISILDNLPPPASTEGAIRRMMTRGYALTNQKRYPQAHEQFAKAADLAKRAAPELRPEVLMNWIAAAFREQKYDLATSLAKEAIAGAQQMRQPFVLANAYGMLGLTELRQGQWEAGFRHCDEAAQFARAAEAHHTLQLISGNVGWAYQQLGDFDEAKVRFEQAQAAAEAAHVLRAQPAWLANITNIYLARGDFQAALTTAERAVAAARQYGDTDLLGMALGNLAQVYIDLRRYDSARSANDQALSQLQKGSVEHSLALISQARLDYAAGKSNAALATLAQVAKTSKEDARVKWQAQAIAASIYGALHRTGEARRMYEAALDSGDAGRAEVHDTDSYLFAFETNLIRFYDEYIELLLANRQTLDALRVAERSRARTLREGLGLLERGEIAATAFSPTALARAHKATILCYWLAPKRSLLWVVSPERVDVVALPSKQVIENQIDVYRRDILDRTATLDSAQGRRLYELLIAPAMNRIHTSRVIIVPDGRLNAMNLEAAVVPTPKPHYWLEEATVSYVPALQFLQPAKRLQKAPAQKLLLVGNVPAEGPNFPALQRAGTEIETIARHFTPAQRIVLTGLAATPRAYLDSAPERFGAIHFAAHGTANERMPLESSVILARGRLTGHDIVKAELAADLVTVSSCNSAGKRSYEGEGLVGLAWAFLRARARRVIAAQWDVSDAASPKLMDVLYDEVSKGRDPADALHDAKLAMLRSGGKNARPFNWAPFILYGAP